MLRRSQRSHSAPRVLFLGSTYAGHKARFLNLEALTPLWVGCATSEPREILRRGFDFHSDTFAYTNNNYWLYDPGNRSGQPIVKRRLENVDHGHRCAIMSRAARQFLYGARFAAELPRVSDAQLTVACARPG